MKGFRQIKSPTSGRCSRIHPRAWVDNIRPIWTSLVKDGRLIGASFGGMGYELSIEEVGICPLLWARAGRYLTIRCMQKLRQHYGEDKYFALGTFRTYTP
ncbi:MAG: hypothetical protein R2911_33900 [Caldilineaceae bacterium]